MKNTLHQAARVAAIAVFSPLILLCQVVNPPASGGGGAGAPFSYAFFGGISQNTVAGWGVSCPGNGGGCPTLVPVDPAGSGDVTSASSAVILSFLSYTKNATSATANSIQPRLLVIPSTWASSTKTITIDLWFRAVATTGNVKFQAAGYCLTPPAVAPNWSSTLNFTTTAVAGTTLQVVHVPTLTITPATNFGAACSAGDLLGLRIWRDGANAADTLSTGTCTTPGTGNGCAEVIGINVGVAQ